MTQRPLPKPWASDWEEPLPALPWPMLGATIGCDVVRRTMFAGPRPDIPSIPTARRPRRPRAGEGTSSGDCMAIRGGRATAILQLGVGEDLVAVQRTAVDEPIVRNPRVLGGEPIVRGTR